jgi:S1-C subfamily serine protease
MDTGGSRRDGTRARIAGTAAVALVAALVGGGVVAALGGGDAEAPATAARTATTAASDGPTATTATATTSAGATAIDFSGVYARRRAGVVSITATVPTSSPNAPGDGTSTAAGSGVVIDDEGGVLTNEHVVDGATSVRVELSSGRTVPATVVGTDKSTDIALLDIDVPAADLDPVPLGDSSDLVIGEPVLAIGDPFGYQASASAGIVSGLGRSIEAPNGFTITGAVQTDAAVNHGNSGGALLDADGELIGIPAQIADSGVNANVGVAFAVPVDTAARIADELRADGSVEHAWLGVSTATVDGALAGVDGVGADSGALITGVVAGGPAARAGIEGGARVATADGQPVCVGGPVVTAVDGAPVTDASGLQEAIDAAAPGATVTLSLVAPDGSASTVRVSLGTRPSTSGAGGATCG